MSRNVEVLNNFERRKIFVVVLVIDFNFSSAKS